MNNKLKPVVFVQGRYSYNAQNTTQQIMLLKALKVTQDPKKLRELIGVKTVADVYRTLDKIAMRKEYHAALAKNGITFDYVVQGLKTEADTAEKSSDRLTALNIILKSIGLDKYEETAIGGGGWEEALLKIKEETKEREGEDADIKTIEYEVVEPKEPEEIRLRKQKENNEAKGLYE
jgi:transposase